MKIININRQSYNLWNSWHNEIKLLHNKINAIYDYIYYTNPHFVIYNAATRPSNAIIDLEESGLVQTITQDNQVYAFFLASALRYRQGFENIINSDYGILCYADENNNWIPLDNDSAKAKWFHNYVFGEYLASYLMEDVVRIDLGEDSADLLCYDNWSNITTFKRWNDSRGDWVTIQPRDIQINSNNHIYVDFNSATALDIQVIVNGLALNRPLSYFVNFPAGYACFFNQQITGEPDSLSSELKRYLNNYLIFPLGNGGYYNYNFLNSVLQSKYYENKLGQLSTQSVVNLSLFPLRYINFLYGTQWKGNQYDIVSYGEDLNSINIGDYVNNVWNGNQCFMPITTLYTNDNTYHEEIITDTTFNWQQTIISNQQVKAIFSARKEDGNNENIQIKFL